MDYQERWLLPTGIGEALPTEAALLEQQRRQLLDLFASWGYDLVIPPLVEYLESLLTHAEPILNLQTFKLTDPLTSRMMGIRADMTPQVARIDAHRLQHDEPTRLCYIGTVLHTRPNRFYNSRSPLQVGAELYGHSGVGSDIEVLRLMLASLRVVGITDFHVDLGHVEIFHRLAAEAGLNAEQNARLYQAIRRKANSDIAELLTQWRVDSDLYAMLAALPHLNGCGDGVLQQARQTLTAAPKAVHHALDQLEQVQQVLAAEQLYIDLAELRGYTYHTGLVFAAYASGHGQSIAKGGRYDHIGAAFGRARPATGFSANLRLLSMLSNQTRAEKNAIFAPVGYSAELTKAIQDLRAQGEVVIQALPEQIEDAQTMGCQRELRLVEEQWVIAEL